MHFIQTLATSLLLVGGAMTQATGSNVVVHVVAVASAEKNTLTFSPNNVVAKPGEMVQFQFHNGNHTVTQSTFAQPCVPINNVMSNVTGFWSGFQGVAQGATSIPTYTVMVNDTKPIWYYCSQGKHCQAGMVGAINAPETGNKTVASFIALAAQAQANLAPGASTSESPSAGASTSSAAGAATTATTTSGSTETSSSTTSSSSAAVASGAASGSIYASPQQILSGGLVAAALSFLL